MNKQLWWLVASLGIIHLLMYITFFDHRIFWYLYSGTALVMIALSIIQSGFDEKMPKKRYMLLGVTSGVAMYGLFYLGYQLIKWLPGGLDGTISNLFSKVQPDNIWKLALLVLIIVPAEEVFWRGFVQQRMQQYIPAALSVLITALLAGSVFYFSGEWVWMAVAFVGGLFWGALYAWKQSLPMLILSHLTFDLLFFYIVFI